MTEQFPPVNPTSVPTGDKKGLAIASLVLGILSLCLIWIPYVGWLGLIGTIIGLILGIMGLKSSGKGMAIAGIIICTFAFILGMLNLVIFGSFLLLLGGPSIGDVFSQINSELVVP